MRLGWTDSAVLDFTSICDYITDRGSPETARRVALSIHKQIESLTKFPEIGRTGRHPETRELVLVGAPYIAVYRINRDAIEILRILHGAQKWP